MSKGWSRIADELEQSADNIKERLNAIVHRRNQIVHEGDMTRAQRPRGLSFNEIDCAEVTEDVDWIDDLIDAMEALF